MGPVSLGLLSTPHINYYSPDDLHDGFLVVENKNDPSRKPIVRIFASCDMGWSGRGNGYSFDSLNGTCSIIGLKTGKVLDYCTKNRKCAQCDSHKTTKEYQHVV